MEGEIADGRRLGLLDAFNWFLRRSPLCSNGIRCFFRLVMAYHNYHDNDYPYYGTEDC